MPSDIDSRSPTARDAGTLPARRLSPRDTLTAITLSKKGHTAAAIAKAIHTKPEFVKQALVDARTLLEVYAPRFAADAIRASHVAADDGNHKPALALLERLDVVTAPMSGPPTAAVGVQVQFVGFGFAGLPPQPQAAAAPAPPALDTTTTKE